MSETKLTLYSYFRSSASARVRTVMNIHNIPHDTKYIHLLKGEQKSPEYSALNAGQSVPTLIIRENGGEWALAQSTAIMEYLDETYAPPGNTLLPKDPKARAQIRSIIALLCGDLFPMLSMRTLNRVKACGGQAEPWANECSTEYLTALEALLKTTSGGKFCYGDRLTLADVAFVPQMYTVLRYSPNIMEELPTIKAVFTHVSVIPEFVAADYMHQPDTPDDQRPK
ncbi:hypothetical protein CcaverHIS002_0111960 [Cutaneotrichosporon cavernicola]|uniref:Maleylacetoacetate isomerase n=1 Tax=Cutaneotrichosporon cavernicola TaxID=279322 RepID=A0AA48I336_9TREE|nr:uncharacterized protein CcaverHIS019_0111850 [Cutaneotrichosporon cavernicola]BEI80667.1 hypothetical protein CcaverHIS002_0111960 [Cutaneotrichosporon cavernicola]BEI88467.1 hypothetical protein CcaverHIS019_0111850 [Cutaneotrichosporon cavernicola]BEI96240.1 hypothetical protein CcaverHIS631_0111890 [Cutaneotrichosporon cavernicola]BEJ04011.1 hypothetical protein CcaverHIS641_0111860 [Cutaneotrichosporon cavernicola]